MTYSSGPNSLRFATLSTISQCVIVLVREEKAYMYMYGYRSVCTERLGELPR